MRHSLPKGMNRERFFLSALKNLCDENDKEQALADLGQDILSCPCKTPDLTEAISGLQKSIPDYCKAT
jgi:hypothetical protein